jgi:reductive dehalogenase
MGTVFNREVIKMSKVKKATYEKYINGTIPRFDDRNGGFSKLIRGEIINKDKLSAPEEKAILIDKLLSRDLIGQARNGYHQEDYALKKAGRTIDFCIRNNFFSRDLEIDEIRFNSSERINKDRIKSVAQWFGADLVGICEVNPVWIYSHWGEDNANSVSTVNTGVPIELPRWAKYAIVMAIAMDYQQLRRSPATEGSTDLAYSKMAFAAASVATYIRNLGYHAIPSGNDLALSIPLAIDAGLGELGRNGMLITDPYGPRVRICKVFTELPLEPDSPIDIGVQHFCERCEICAELCPSRAIKFGDRTDRAWDNSNSMNVLKWPVKAVSCLRFWIKNRTDCAVCLRSCPFNKPKGLLHTVVRRTIRTTSRFDRLFIRMDKRFKYGEQVLTQL